jgi:hypothetical protein
MQAPEQPHTHVRVGGDFARVFDHEDYLGMVNSLDEASVVLRAHLVLEEFLNIWSSRSTRTEDLFAGTFVPFKTKLCVCRNLGLSAEYFEVLDKFNEIRNRYSHRRKYALEPSTLDSLRKKVDAVASDPQLLPCDQFELFVEGTNSNNERKQITHTWATADTKKRIIVLLVVLVLKLVQWMQREFNARGIHYNLVAWPAPTPSL